jgi:glycosyltransferase involved in cell wall biosynthesis
MAMNDRPRISACVTTLNEERNIARCLRSVAWCDEVVVVDSLSADRTVELAREFTDRVYQHEWLGYIGQKNLCMDFARYPWVLFVDADEEVSPELRDEILAELSRHDGRIAGYEFPRMVCYLGRWIRHGEWYPDYKLRLFRKDAGRSEGREPHDRVVVDGPVKRLRSPLRHYTYDDLRDHLDTINRFSTITAREKYKAGARSRWVDLFFRPWARFLKAYVLRLGFLDGRRGLIIALFSAFDVCAKYAKLWERDLAASVAAKNAESAPAKAGASAEPPAGTGT